MAKQFSTTGSGFSRQRGAVLIVGLIILLLMTMIGLTAMQGTSQQERMSGNLRDGNVALQAGEAAVRLGERMTIYDREEKSGTYVEAVSDNTRGQRRDPGEAKDTHSALWSTSSNTNIKLDDLGEAEPTSKTAKAPSYMAEKLLNFPASPSEGMPPKSTLDAFRVTGYGTGGRETSESLVQSISIRVP